MEPLSQKWLLRQLVMLLDRLGWQGLQSNCTSCECPDGDDRDLSDDFFSIGEMDDALYLQVNPLTFQHPRLFGICVYAMQYGLCSGWHGLVVDPSESFMLKQVERLRPWVHRSNFDSAAARLAYREAHPECDGWSWARIQRNAGPCYSQLSCLGRIEGR